MKNMKVVKYVDPTSFMAGIDHAINVIQSIPIQHALKVHCDESGLLQVENMKNEDAEDIAATISGWIMSEGITALHKGVNDES